MTTKRTTLRKGQTQFSLIEPTTDLNPNPSAGDMIYADNEYFMIIAIEMVSEEWGFTYSLCVWRIGDDYSIDPDDGFASNERNISLINIRDHFEFSDVFLVEKAEIRAELR